ncbi:MAG TPA: sterol desaturase family protein [Hymenobacter sp.]|uniref:sterol desaturase family protein n=1 Tax=Hymenobacter sp. TaxID=1898978 RepID=UPI002D7F557A|nr:sterol desaturase family protein [Hymenobacter sp.]HET9503984.1 sterol desaturase family protein [Hymenobacter sp.]
MLDTISTFYHSLDAVGRTTMITTPILLLAVAVLLVLERKFPYRKGLPFFREGLFVDLFWYTLVQSYFLQILIFGFIIAPLAAHFGARFHVVSSWPVAAQVAFFVITHDFYIYWFHRFQHSSAFFWRTHEAHHSGKHVDWLAGSRSHIVEIIINQTIEFAPIILLGANPIVVPIKALIDAVWGMYIHANIDVKSGKLQYVINGPEMHLWHHADHEEVYYANFSTKFAFWDWMFGTAFLPANRKPERWGLPYAFPKDYFAQHAFSVVRFDEAALAEKSAVFRAYHGVRWRVLGWVGEHVPAAKVLQGWPVDQGPAETVPAPRPGGNPAPTAPVVATATADSSRPVATPVA